MKSLPEVVILVVSDRRSAGTLADQSGPVIDSWVREQRWHRVDSSVIPDDPEEIAAKLRYWSDERGVALILTTGGTGLSPRDQTPEATLSIADRLVPGIPEWIRASTGEKNRFAYLSRGVAVIRGGTLIVNLPGSLRAVHEYLPHLGKILPHALSQLSSEPGSPEADDHPDSYPELD